MAFSDVRTNVLKCQIFAIRLLGIHFKEILSMAERKSACLWKIAFSSVSFSSTCYESFVDSKYNWRVMKHILDN